MSLYNDNAIALILTQMHIEIRKVEARRQLLLGLLTVLYSPLSKQRYKVTQKGTREWKEEVQITSEQQETGLE